MTNQEIYRLFIENFDIIDLGEAQVKGERKILVQPRDDGHEFMAVIRIDCRQEPSSP